MRMLQRWNKKKFTRCRLTTPITTIPDTSNMTAAALPRSPKHLGNTKKIADRPVAIMDTLQHTLLVHPEVRSVETAIRRTILLEYVTPSR